MAYLSRQQFRLSHWTCTSDTRAGGPLPRTATSASIPLPSTCPPRDHSVSKTGVFDKANGHVSNTIGVRVVVAVVLGLVALIVHFRGSRFKLLEVIKKEAGLYLAMSLGNGLLRLWMRNTLC